MWWCIWFSCSCCIAATLCEMLWCPFIPRKCVHGPWDGFIKKHYRDVWSKPTHCNKWLRSVLVICLIFLDWSLNFHSSFVGEIRHNEADLNTALCLILLFSGPSSVQYAVCKQSCCVWEKICLLGLLTTISLFCWNNNEPFCYSFERVVCCETLSCLRC